MSQLHRCDRQSQDYAEKDRGTPCSVLMRGKEGDERANYQSGDEAADVGRIVDARQRKSENEVVNDKRAQAPQRAGERSARHRELP